MSKNSPRLRSRRVPEVTSTEEGYRRLQLTALADGVYDVDKTIEEYNRLRAHLPNLRRVLRWMGSKGDDPSPDGISFADACRAFDRDPEAVANHILRKIPKPLYWLAQYDDNPFPKP